jgi:hypothetical protein
MARQAYSVPKSLAVSRISSEVLKLSLTNTNHNSKTKKQTDRNKMAENLATKAIAAAAPSAMLRTKVGLVSQPTNANTARIIAAASAKSLVAKPACARTGGRVVKSRTAKKPADALIVCVANPHFSHWIAAPRL